MEMKWRSWICFVSAIVTGVLGYACGKRNSPPACDVADSYGSHPVDTTQVVTCPDKRQTLEITRKGIYIGSFEYRCHCD